MNVPVSRLFSFLPLLMLLPATSSAFFLPIPVIKPHPAPSYAFHPSELCPLIHIVENELCNNAALKHTQPKGSGSPIPELCALLQQYNTSFCAKVDKTAEGMSNDDMSVIVLQKEYHAANANKSDEHHEPHEHHVQDIHKLCPILNFIEQELCTSRNKHQHHSAEDEFKVEFDPKQLCPLLNLTYTEFC